MLKKNSSELSVSLWYVLLVSFPVLQSVSYDVQGSHMFGPSSCVLLVLLIRWYAYLGGRRDERTSSIDIVSEPICPL